MLTLGTVVKPYGKLGAIANIDGERFYFFNKRGDVSMIAAALIERTQTEQGKKG